MSRSGSASQDGRRPASACTSPNPSFTDYLIPTILDMPPVRLDVLELADITGFGGWLAYLSRRAG